MRLNFGLKLQERCMALGLKCELLYRGADKAAQKDVAAYLIAAFKQPGVPIFPGSGIPPEKWDGQTFWTW